MPRSTIKEEEEELIRTKSLIQIHLPTIPELKFNVKENMWRAICQSSPLGATRVRTAIIPHRKIQSNTITEIASLKPNS